MELQYVLLNTNYVFIKIYMHIKKRVIYFFTTSFPPRKMNMNKYRHFAIFDSEDLSKKKKKKQVSMILHFNRKSFKKQKNIPII